MDMRWNLEPLYSSFESEEYISDSKELDARIAGLNNQAEAELIVSKAKELSPEESATRIGKYLDSFIRISKLYSGLSLYAELTFSVDASNTEAKKHTEILEQKLPELTKATVIFTRWIAEISNLDSIIQNSSLLKEHRFFLQEKIESGTYLLSDREELLAARLKIQAPTHGPSSGIFLLPPLKLLLKQMGKKKNFPSLLYGIWPTV